MDINQSLVAELEDAIKSGSKEKRVDTLRRITDLFVADADRLNDRQIDVFDDVLGHLIKRVEDKALAELSRRLGPINSAPSDVVRSLARHDNIDVAAPVLTQSARLTDKDLIEIAGTKTQAHLLAISGRAQIGAEVTDVLLQRGDQKVVHRLAENSGAKFSEQGYSSLVKHSERDEDLAAKVGLRLDVPLRLFRELLARATEAVRSRLMALAGPESRAHIQRVLSVIAEDVQHEAGFQNQQDYAEAEKRALAMKEEGRLGEGPLIDAIKEQRVADAIAMLSVMCAAPLPMIQNLLQNGHREAFLIPCKAAGLAWATVRSMLSSRVIGRTLSDPDLDLAHGDYSRLSPASAQRVLRFWQVRQSATTNAATDAAAPSEAAKEPKVLASAVQ